MASTSRPDFCRGLIVLGVLLTAGNAAAGVRPILAVHVQTGTPGITATTSGEKTLTQPQNDPKQEEERRQQEGEKRREKLKQQQEAEKRREKLRQEEEQRQQELKRLGEQARREKLRHNGEQERRELHRQRLQQLRLQQQQQELQQRRELQRQRLQGASLALGIVSVIGFLWFVKSRYKRQMPAPGSAFNKGNRSVSFQFRVRRLPLHVRVKWEPVAETSAPPVLSYDDDVVETHSNQWKSLPAARNMFHSISLALPAGDLPDSLEFKLHIGLAFPFSFWALFERRLSAADFQRVNTPPAKVELSPYKEAPPPQIRIETVVTAPYATARPRLRKPPSEALVELANEWLASGVPSRPLIERRFADLGFKPEFYSPTRVPESANSVYTRHWFVPDSHAGAWLMLIDDGDRLIVPVDRERFRDDTMRHYVSSLYDGVARNFPDGVLRIDHLCHLVPAREPDEYQVTQKGCFAGTIIESQAADSRRDEQTRSNSQQLFDYPMGALRERVVRLEERFNRADAEALRSAAAVDNHKRDLDQRRLIEETASKVIDAKVTAAVAPLERKIADIQNELTLLKRAQVPALAATPVQLALPAPEPLPSPPSIEPRVQEMSITRRASVTSGPTLPKGWQSTLSSGTDDYLDALQVSQRRLAALGGDGAVQVVHLIEAADGGLFQVHDEPLDHDSGGLVAWCAARPGARMRTPVRQLFLGWREPGERAIWVLCPTGAYSALGFHYQDLIRNAGDAFTIASVCSPARLDPSHSDLYRVSSLMDVEFE